MKLKIWKAGDNGIRKANSNSNSNSNKRSKSEYEPKSSLTSKSFFSSWSLNNSRRQQRQEKKKKNYKNNKRREKFDWKALQLHNSSATTLATYNNNEYTKNNNYIYYDNDSVSSLECDTTTVTNTTSTIVATPLLTVPIADDAVVNDKKGQQKKKNKFGKTNIRKSIISSITSNNTKKQSKKKRMKELQIQEQRKRQLRASIRSISSNKDFSSNSSKSNGDDNNHGARNQISNRNNNRQKLKYRMIVKHPFDDAEIEPIYFWTSIPALTMYGTLLLSLFSHKMEVLYLLPLSILPMMGQYGLLWQKYHKSNKRVRRKARKTIQQQIRELDKILFEPWRHQKRSELDDEDYENRHGKNPFTKIVAKVGQVAAMGVAAANIKRGQEIAKSLGRHQTEKLNTMWIDEIEQQLDTYKIDDNYFRRQFKGINQCFIQETHELLQLNSRQK